MEWMTTAIKPSMKMPLIKRFTSSTMMAMEWVGRRFNWLVQPAGLRRHTAGDCDDSNGSVKPNVSEMCNGIDNCNGSIDENIPTNAWYLDADGDSFGTSGIVAYIGRNHLGMLQIHLIVTIPMR